MTEAIALAGLAVSETAALFEGRDHGSSVSCFVTNHPPGAGVPLHRHPYEETFVVLGGSAEFTAGDQTMPVDAGHVLVVPADTAHGFTSTGDEPLRLVSVHPSDHVVQEWLERD